MHCHLFVFVLTIQSYKSFITPANKMGNCCNKFYSISYLTERAMIRLWLGFFREPKLAHPTKIYGCRGVPTQLGVGSGFGSRVQYKS